MRRPAGNRNSFLVCSQTVQALALAACFLAAARFPCSAQQAARLAQVKAAYDQLQGLSAEIRIRRSGPNGEETLEGRASLRKPNLARLQLGDAHGLTIVCDGTNQWTLLPSANRCLKRRLPHPRSIQLLGAKPLSLFFEDHGFAFGMPVEPESVKVVEETSGPSGSFEVIEVASRVVGRQQIRYSIGPDRLVHRMAAQLEWDARKVLYEVELRNLRIDPPLASTEFEFAPPAGVTVQDEGDEARCVDVGQAAPEFVLEDLEGKPLSLETVRQGAEAVLINFWFLRCAPCLAEFPRLARLHADFHPEGLEVLAINASDPADKIKAFREANNYGFAMASAGWQGVHWHLLEINPYPIVVQYDVSAFPTNLLLDKNGRVVLRMAGFDEAALRRALSELGLGTPAAED